MPQNYTLAEEQWARYLYARENGHRDFVEKSNRCDDFFVGEHWDKATKQQLEAVKRPALTINTVLITLASIFGEQIDLRSETTFRPRYGSPPKNAEVLSKLYKYVSDDNQLPWLRSEVFADGCITSRGFFDCRLRFDRNIAGDVQLSQLNPRSVVLDPDASQYDPDTWNDVTVTSWLTADDIAVTYTPEDADLLRHKSESVWPQGGFDSIDTLNDRFGGRAAFGGMSLSKDNAQMIRGIRVIDRQYRKLAKMKYLIDPKTGDRMGIPDHWDRDAIALATRGGLIVSEELGKRVRWTVTAEDVVLHDSWSPYKRFTIVPFFPYMRHGRTVGIVEGLIDPALLLDKSLSQELHIVNTMANSGWKIKTGSLKNMQPDELEQQGARTGLVLELGDVKDAEKIQPNQIPTGLDRLSFKAENYIKSVSGRGNNQLGLTRPDQSGKLTEESNKASDGSLRKVLDNLERTDYLLARNILDMFQRFYTDHRIVNITRDALTGEQETVEINMPDPKTGEMVNDLSLGMYDAVITSQNARRTLEEGEFAQAVELRTKAGVQIPDKFIILNSNLRGKADIVKEMEAQAASPQAQLQAQVGLLTISLEAAEKKAEVSKLEAEAVARRAKAAESTARTAEIMRGDGESPEQKMAMQEAEHEQKMRHQQEEHEQALRLKEADAAEARRTKRIQAIAAGRQQASKGAQQAKQ